MATKSSTQEMESLVINKVASPAVYQSMVTNNQINENELYLVMGDETPEASSTTPAMDGTASTGSLTTYARGDHVHPTDTSRAPTSHASSATTYGIGTSSNYGHVKLADSVVYSYSSKSVSGSTVTFDDGYNTNASALTVTMATTQSGSGDPSPTNIRPISGFTGANIYVSHTNNAADGTTYPVSWIHADTDTASTPGNFYVSQGTLNVLTGELTVNAILNVFDTEISGGISSKLWSLSSSASSVDTIGSYTRVSFANRTEVNRTQYNLSSNTYTTAACNLLKHQFSYAAESTSFYINAGSLYAKFPTSLVGSTAASVVTYLMSIKDTTPLSILIPLASPVTYQLTAKQVETLLGTNYVWSNAGDISLTYTAATANSAEGTAASISAVSAAMIDAKTYAEGYADGLVPITKAVTLTTAGWSGNAQTVAVAGVSADETAQLITVTPAIASQSDYLAAGVKATAQAANSITFSCDTTPTEALTVYVTIQEVNYVLVLTVSWSGSGTEKTSTVINATEAAAYLTIPFVGDDSRVVAGATAQTETFWTWTLCYNDAACTDFAGYYKPDTEGIQASKGTPPYILFDTKTQVAPAGYYVKVIVEKRNTSVFATNADAGGYLNEYAATVVME